MTKVPTYRSILFSFLITAYGTLGIAEDLAPPILSVGIQVGIKSASVSAQHGFQVFDLTTSRKLLFTRWNSTSLKFQITSRGFGFLKNTNLRTVEIKPFRKGLVYLNGKGYRGKFKLFEDRFGKITVVNLVDLESYLYGVIKSEMLINSPLEALKAQAVVARTYAIKNQKKFQTELGFGLTDDVRSQVYNGIEDEHPIARKVVKMTRGRIAIHDDTPISAFYHSSCGGSTLNSKDWHGKSIPYLLSKPCPYCEVYKDYGWKVEFPYSKIKNQLRVRGHKIAVIEGLKARTRPDGRLSGVEIQHSSGTIKLTGTKFRQLMGASVVRSTMVATEDVNLASNSKASDKAEMAILSIIYGQMQKYRSVTFKGTGFGHGVGLCQWGAKGLALKGFNFEKILKYYYSGVAIKKLYN